MTAQLTKKAKINAEALRIARLTNEHDAYFKLILSHQLEKKFNFNSLQKGKKTSEPNTIKIFKALGKFIDSSTNLTITEVENAYGRPTDRADGTFDPETKSQVEIQHLCLFKDEDKTNPPADSVRIHGYFRTNGGYFVITRLDWFHSFHKW